MTTTSLRLLLIEGDLRLCTSLARALRSTGYQVVVADSVAEARSNLEQSYDLILLDLGLPDGVGSIFVASCAPRVTGRRSSF